MRSAAGSTNGGVGAGATIADRASHPSPHPLGHRAMEHLVTDAERHEGLNGAEGTAGRRRPPAAAEGALLESLALCSRLADVHFTPQSHLHSHLHVHPHAYPHVHPHAHTHSYPIHTSTASSFSKRRHTCTRTPIRKTLLLLHPPLTRPPRPIHTTTHTASSACPHTRTTHPQDPPPPPAHWPLTSHAHPHPSYPIPISLTFRSQHPHHIPYTLISYPLHPDFAGSSTSTCFLTSIHTPIHTPFTPHPHLRRILLLHLRIDAPGEPLSWRGHWFRNGAKLQYTR